MCLLPPNCIFCSHYHHEVTVDGWDCDAYEEIPEVIFEGGNAHTEEVPDDQGFRFELNPELEEEYNEVEELKREIMNDS